MTFFSQILRSTRFRRLLGDRTGASAIEFALLLPLLFVLLAGSVDIGQALTVQRKITQISSTASEMISMQNSWTPATAQTILTGASSILEPFDKTGLSILLSVVEPDSSGKATVKWSIAYGTKALNAGQASPTDIPADLVDAGVQMVVTHVQYTFETPFSAFCKSFTGLDAYSFERYFFIRPRNSDTINYG